MTPSTINDQRSTPGIIATRDELILARSTPVALVDCTLPQLETLHQSFADLEKLHDRGSGVAATLRGLVLTEIKAKLKATVGHGQFTGWLKEHYGKDVRTAQRYMLLAGEFVKQTKNDKLVVFDLLTQSAGEILAGVEELKLDLANPTVAAVIAWSEGKSANQLLLALEDSKCGNSGGNRHPQCPHCAADLKSKTQAVCQKCHRPTGLVPLTPEQQLSELKLTVQDWAARHLQDPFLARGTWKIAPKMDALAVAAHFRTKAREIEEWFAMPEARRAELSLEELLAP